MRGLCIRRCFKRQQGIRWQRKATASTFVGCSALASFASSFHTLSFQSINKRERKRCPLNYRGHSFPERMLYKPEIRTFSLSKAGNDTTENIEVDWQYFFPFSDWTHNSTKIIIPGRLDSSNADNADEDLFSEKDFKDRLNSTVNMLKNELRKTSVWIEVHISRSSLIEEMAKVGFHFHHAQGNKAVLNLWLKDSESLVPEFATHHVGVGALVINSRDEVLVVRELSKNVLPWKLPGGLAELGEHIDEAAVREVYEETSIKTRFRNVVCFRHTHGMANRRSDIYFVCRMELIEEIDEEGNKIIPEPIAQEGEIAATAWIPYTQFRNMVNGEDGHPMISHVLNVSERGDTIEQKLINNVVPGKDGKVPIYSAPSPLHDEKS